MGGHVIKKYIKNSILFFFLVIIVVLFFIFYFFNQQADLATVSFPNFEIVSISDTEKSPNDIEQISYPFFSNVNYFLSIPAIQLYRAPIKEGTSQSVMKKYIGHFEHTSFLKGNIGLASHNRGSGANYFSNLKNIRKGDIIFYQNHSQIFSYEVDLIQTIDEYDWHFLQDSNEDKLTLITCIENKENLRLCVQARKREIKEVI